MLRKILFLSIVAGCLLWSGGCKKDSPEVQVKSPQEYKAEADKAIDASNMDSELEKIEKEVEAEPDIE